MLSLALDSLLLLALTVAAPDQPLPPNHGNEVWAFSDLMTSFREADVAEIYIIRRSIEFRISPRPNTVRAIGCRYRVYRATPEWEELERELAEGAVQISPAAGDSEVRIALILGDRRGTLREVYSRWPHGSETIVNGYSQRRPAAISSNFARAMQAFTANHPELAEAPATAIPVCTPDPAL
jgi:hypothetical protein